MIFCLMFIKLTFFSLIRSCFQYHLQKSQSFMSGKREASYSIDPNTLQARENDQQVQNQEKTNGAKQQKSQRKIFKIKRDATPVTQQKESKVSFKLNESQQIKSSNQTKDDNKDANNQKDSKKQKPLANPFQNLFKNDNKIFNGIGIFSNVKSTNLFTSNVGTQESAKTVTSSLGNASIFANKGLNLFDNSTTKNTTNAKSTFVQNQNNNDDQGSGDSAQLEKAQNIQADPQQSKASYNYDNSCPILLTLKVSKFKRNGGELIQNVEVVLQKQKQKGIKYISVRLIATKKIIFSGILLQGKCEVKHIHGKKQNVQVSAFYKQKSSFSKAVLKFQFCDASDGQKLYQRLEQLLKKQNESN